jgi:hypothetical protein
MHKILFTLIAAILCSFSFAQNDKPIEVKVTKVGTSFQLYRNGVPYYIKGGGGYDYLDILKQAGGNSVRIWGHEQAKEILDKAQKLGLTVMVGLYVEHERHGFDYNDEELVEKQLEKFRRIVADLKDHPALLLWGVGNEVNLNYRNMNVWHAVEGIAKMIHEEDKLHPTVTVLSGINPNDIRQIKERCPDIDILGINAYGNILTVPGKIRDAEWDRPYIITEWGPTGQWECLKTNWEAPIEESSTEKAALCKTRYENAVAKDKELCLGSYIFKWGNKQEVTSTWFSTILETGEETELVGTMQYLWTGNYPLNTAPKIVSFLFNGKTAGESVRLIKLEDCKATIIATDDEKDILRFEWEVLHESNDLKEGGDEEEKPFTLDDKYKTGAVNELVFKAPRRKGQYRLFVYIYDGHNHVATANIPFYVKNH